MKTKMFHAAGFLAATTVVALSLAGCASGGAVASSTAGASCTLPSEIKLVAIKDQTGVAALAGSETWKGIQLAQDDIAKSGLLKGASLNIKLNDPAGVAQTAASQASAAMADPDVAAILGPVNSDAGLAVAPLASKGKTPVIYSQAGADGIVDQNYNFRATPPLLSFYPKIGQFLSDQKVKKVAIMYSSDNPTLTQLATKIVPGFAQQDGFQVTNTVAITATSQDLSSTVSKVLSNKPDAIALLVAGTQVVSAQQQLQQAGFTGQVVTYPNAVVGLKQLGDAGKGTVLVTNFDASVHDPAVQAFVAAFGKKFSGAVPTNYAAEGYDSMMWLAKAIAKNGCASRDSIKAGLEAIGHEGFTGAQGPLTFIENGHDAHTAGVLVRWDGSKLVVIP